MVTIFPKESDAAWAAGFFDGEGCVAIYKTNSYFRPSLTIAQKDKRPLLKLQSVYGGFIRNQRGEIWEWYLSKRNHIAEFLYSVHPFLTTKGEQSAVMLEFLQQPWRGRHWGRKGKPYSAIWSDTLLTKLIKQLKYKEEANISSKIGTNRELVTW